MPQGTEGATDVVPSRPAVPAPAADGSSGRDATLARTHPHDRPGYGAKRQAAARSLLQGGRRWRHAARYLGLAIFCIGAILLGYVFYKALNGFDRFSRNGYLAGELNQVAGDDTGYIPWNRIQAVVAVIGSELFQLLYLLLLGFLGSAIAAKGIQFFAASEAVIDEAVIDENLLVEFDEG